MAEIRLTEAQRAAVEDRGGTLLVSAAAGSGKTKVLVDRLMSRVCDPDDPKDLSDFLIITYTKAAAAELRGKISAELGRRLAADPGSRHLRRQTGRIYQTEISTVHAFCANLLRGYAHALDLPSDFRVAEENECAVLRERVIDETLEAAYARLGETPDVQALIDLFGYGRDDRGVAKAVASLYRAAQCRLDPDKWVADCRAALELSGVTDCARTPWGGELLARLRAFAGEQTDAMERAVGAMTGDAKMEKAYGEAFRELLGSLRELLSAQDWDAARAALPAAFSRLKPLRDPDAPDLAERLRGVRARCVDGLKEQREIFYGDSAEVMVDLRASAQAMLGAFDLLGQMTEGYRREKRRRRMLDFSDLEHEAVRLLIDRSSGGPTAAAREVAGRYCEIMVDEYQDSNEVQDCIFRAVSRGGENRFMVGDVKQSIYRFRLADPSIFLEKYRTYRDYREAEPGEPRRVLLSENFRSRPEILEAANFVFRAVMSERVGNLDYGDAEALRPGLTFPPASSPRVELHCLPVDGDKAKADAEAGFVAARIARLLAEEHSITDGAGTRPVRPEDIVILLRSVASAAPVYVAALRARGIACVCDRGESILDTAEIETLLAVLEVIDNPHQDIPLVAALASPLFAFTADELGAVRAGRRTGDFYEALSDAAKGNRRIGHFLGTLTALRERAKWMLLPELLREVLRVTDAEAVYGAMPDGAAQLENLHAFSALAVSSGKRTLPEFVRYAAELREQGMTVSSGAAAREGGAVTILSIHKSKGLEFPVVVLADLSRKFNLEDLREPVLTHPALFAGGNVIDRENGVRYPTVAKKAIALRLQQETVSEELRVLYVAMTRAKDMLLMTYASRYLESELKAVSGWGFPAPPDEAARARCPGAWVLGAALCRAEANELFAVTGGSGESRVSGTPWLIRLHGADETEETAVSAALVTESGPKAAEYPAPERVRELLAFRYPHPGAAAVPSKLTATQLKGRSVDEEAAEGSRPAERPRGLRLRRPDFVSEAAGLSAAERGTANHLFLQFARYEACTTPEGVEAEVRRLSEGEFLTPAQADAVRREAMVRLFVSPLGERLRGAEKVTREFKFSILTDAEAYFPGAAGERVMLQGVADCFFEEEDGLTVLDFKTDAVRPGGEAERAEHYRAQLAAYADALGRICGKPVQRRILWFLATGMAAEV